jgi:hypothetical protein
MLTHSHDAANRRGFAECLVDLNFEVCRFDGRKLFLKRMFRPAWQHGADCPTRFVPCTIDFTLHGSSGELAVIVRQPVFLGSRGTTDRSKTGDGRFMLAPRRTVNLDSIFTCLARAKTASYNSEATFAAVS